MPEMPLGRFVWHELMTTDVPAAKAFYPRVIGWDLQQFPMPGVDYSMWMNGDTPVGGLMELAQEARDMGAPPNWLGYISTPDVDATVAEAKRRGAQVLVGPVETPTVGRWAILRDPQGAVFAVFRAATPGGGPPTDPAIGDFSWHELATTDLDAGFGFYSALFGWTLEADHDMGPMGIYRIFGSEGRQLGGMYLTPADMPAPSHWLPYTRVASADEAAGRVTDAHGTILHGPADVPGGDRIVMCADPQGAAFALHSTAGNG